MVIKNLRERFQLNLTSDNKLDEFIENKLILSSLNSVFTKLYDSFQYFSQGVFFMCVCFFGGFDIGSLSSLSSSSMHLKKKKILQCSLFLLEHTQKTHSPSPSLHLFKMFNPLFHLLPAPSISYFLLNLLLQWWTSKTCPGCGPCLNCLSKKPKKKKNKRMCLT
ncbi:uncharacterized protein VP01_2287g1 [Puccinia sorghi]|uniref:Uncharacterized protein n=1 Tax=Puccinia sorghi TaxID=27349 RepID=A0A0L6V7Z5_9BASI|nr:uncharacterized protein VP01_2287g1 [Puccinia sorghi]